MVMMIMVMMMMIGIRIIIFVVNMVTELAGRDQGRFLLSKPRLKVNHIRGGEQG